MASAKKGFDKDYVFNLIMPSSPASDEEFPPGSEPADVEEAPGQDTLSLLQEQLRQQTVPAVKLNPTKELVLVNLMEQLVTDRLDEVFAKFNCCRCDKCRRDVAAIALNALPPKYVVAEPDDIPHLLSQTPTKEISTALIKAILSVKNNPQH